MFSYASVDKPNEPEPLKAATSRRRMLLWVAAGTVILLCLVYWSYTSTMCSMPCTPNWAASICGDRIVKRMAPAKFPGRQAALDAHLALHPQDVSGGAQAWMDACPLGSSWASLVPVEPLGDLRRSYLQSNWHAGLPGGASCANLDRIGLPGDGGKNLCGTKALASKVDCNVISVGSNGDASFEEAIHNIAPGCRIDTFDGTLNDHKRSQLPSYVNFHAFNFGVDTWKVLVEAGICQLSILKMDCEGCEYDCLPAFIEQSPICVEQIVVEVHTCQGGLNTLKNMHQMMHRLARNYSVFAYEANLEFSDGTCGEFSLLRRTPCPALAHSPCKTNTKKEHTHSKG